MDVADFIHDDRILLDLKVRDKAALLRDLAQRAAGGAGVDAAAIEAALQARETLGSTGLGKGFALPHARIDGLAGFVGVYARLARPIDFQAVDGKAVDLVFALLLPANAEASHIVALAAVSRRFRDEVTLTRLRRSTSAADTLAILLG